MGGLEGFVALVRLENSKQLTKKSIRKTSS